MSTKARKPLDDLRQRRGPVPDELRERVKEHTRIQKAITAALSQGPRTAVEIAAATGIPREQVFWHLMAMRKYGEVAEGEESDGYFQYALTKKEQQ